LPRSIDVLDRIAHSDDAVFALDGNDLVILWNKSCEDLTGRPAYQVLGKRCYDVLCGRDVYGNMYCCPSCPVSIQARMHQDDPVQRFHLDVATTGGGKRRLSITVFAIPSTRPALATLVHVLREPDREASPLERELEEAVADRPQPRTPRRTPEGQLAALTHREAEILRGMAEGLTTTAIAAQTFISPVTVRNHIAKILAKLDVHTKLAAVAFAYRNGLVTAEPSPPAARRAGASRASSALAGAGGAPTARRTASGPRAPSAARRPRKAPRAD
jgi:DNA-binding CsgD family transcriptional regulator